LGLEWEATFENAIVNRPWVQRIVSEEESMRPFEQLETVPITPIVHEPSVNRRLGRAGWQSSIGPSDNARPGPKFCRYPREVALQPDTHNSISISSPSVSAGDIEGRGHFPFRAMFDGCVAHGRLGSPSGAPNIPSHLWVLAKANSMNTVLKLSKFNDFLLKNDQKIHKHATGAWKLT
jgi:hypothetical protein